VTGAEQQGRPKVAVVGAGRMGHGIALEFARGGHAVGLYDLDARRLADALAEARRDVQDLVAADVLAPTEVAATLARITPSADLEHAVAGARFVNEAIAEDLAAKRDLFARLDRLCPPPAILASNTSSISISAIAEACTRPERVVLAHWVLPPHLVPVVEVAPGRRTDDVTVQATRSLLEALGKWPVYVKQDIPGYLLNRLQFALLREAFHLIEAGIVTPADLDRLIQGSLGRRMPVVGVMRQADLAGLDVYNQIFKYLGPDLNASPAPPRILAQALADGRRGAVAGQGMYAWSAGEADTFIQRRNAWLVRLLRDDRAAG